MREYLGIGALVGAAAVSWHIGVVTTTSASVLNPEAGLDAVRALTGVGSADKPTWTTVVVAISVLALAAIIGGIVLLRRDGRRSRHSDAHLASGREISRLVTDKKNHALTEPFALLGGRPLRLRHEDNGAVVGAPRSGKTSHLVVGLVKDAPGAVVATSTKPDVHRLSAGTRAGSGRVYIFDPEGVSRWPAPVAWDLVRGCENPEEAQERADGLVAPSAQGDGGNARFFQQSSATVLRCLLHAAAFKPGGSMRDVLRWTRNFEDDEPYDLLRDHGVEGWEGDLRSYCRGAADETVSSTQMSLGLVMRPFTIPSIMDSVCPRTVGGGLDTRGFHDTKDTLYLLSRPGQAPMAAPIITALVMSIERAARNAASHTASGRIDPPMTLVLDEVTNVAPIRGLDSLMSDGSGRGVITWVFVQSREQLAERYGRSDAKTILDSAAAFLLLPGSKDLDHLKELSALVGEADTERTSYTVTDRTTGGSTQHSTERRALLSPEALRMLRLPDALLIYRNAPAAVVQLVPYWNRRDKAEFTESSAWTLKQEGFGADAAAGFESRLRDDVAEEQATAGIGA